MHRIGACPLTTYMSTSTDLTTYTSSNGPDCIKCPLTNKKQQLMIHDMHENQKNLPCTQRYLSKLD